MSSIQCVFITSIAIILVTLIGQRFASVKILAAGFKTNVECEFSDATFIYKIQIHNELSHVINNITAKLMMYPKDCMELIGQDEKTITMIESGKSEKLEFQFIPIKDYVEGQIQSSISYIDTSGEHQTVYLEPFAIQSVCNLLNPIELPVQQFDLFLSKMDAISEDILLEAQPEVLFEKAQGLLSTKNFFVIDTEMYADDELYTAIIRGYAVGMYIQKKIAIVLTVTRTSNVEYTTVKVQAHGDDIVMLHTAINEIVSELEKYEFHA